ncbi:MSHA pilin protein MshD [Propionivibrio dicarboxylicus]|uniref:MSHA pilin protein MshD n=1 Tax=Propionivibrio dicarboxylicus TaxID=83767 RepID=A0A1G8BX89_9RHOO|nr:MSHA pilin protein MshD [Propionivibrio dicarboxylicus]
MCSKTTRGFTLIEMVIAIVIISIGFAGVLMAINSTVRNSADPLVRKQMLAIAEEMLEEVLIKPFAVSGDAPVNVAKACGVSPPPSRTTFDDIKDYNNYQTVGICDVDGQPVTGLVNYNVHVTVIDNALGDITTQSGAAAQVVVSVVHGTEHILLSGWRTNYAQ